MDACVSALLKSTGIKTATQYFREIPEMRTYEYPAVYLIDENTEISPFSIQSTGTANDMQAVISLRCHGYVHDGGNIQARIDTKRTDLCRDIESSLVGSTALAALDTVLLIEPTGIDTDAGFTDNYAMVDVWVDITYIYNHASP